jgi:hypothetical protein
VHDVIQRACRVSTLTVTVTSSSHKSSAPSVTERVATALRTTATANALRAACVPGASYPATHGNCFVREPRVKACGHVGRDTCCDFRCTCGSSCDADCQPKRQLARGALSHRRRSDSMAADNGNDTYSSVHLNDDDDGQDLLLDWDAFAASRRRGCLACCACASCSAPACWYRLSTRQRCECSFNAPESCVVPLRYPPAHACQAAAMVRIECHDLTLQATPPSHAARAGCRP